MDDKQIIGLYLKRNEAAISETQNKYGRYCHYIAYNILGSDQDAEECVNDTCHKVWYSIPPEQPHNFSAFIAKITRNLALDKYRKYAAKKRIDSQTALALDELSECIPSPCDVESVADKMDLSDALSRFIKSLSPQSRKVFVRRYWYLSSIKEIAEDYNISESKVKMLLLRTRNKLKLFLEKEGVQI
ncbi:MAG: RNA polymerase sigma factor [Clostridia bacterium]|nr:RNA polymerase sigma factor [Clostridia bacterium]